MSAKRPITVQDAIKILDATEEPAMADAMAGNLEKGYLEAALDEEGVLHFHVTKAGQRHVEDDLLGGGS